MSMYIWSAIKYLIPIQKIFYYKEIWKFWIYVFLLICFSPVYNKPPLALNPNSLLSPSSQLYILCESWNTLSMCIFPHRSVWNTLPELFIVQSASHFRAIRYVGAGKRVHLGRHRPYLHGCMCCGSILNPIFYRIPGWSSPWKPWGYGSAKKTLHGISSRLIAS